jgi:hypothetical protein
MISMIVMNFSIPGLRKHQKTEVRLDPHGDKDQIVGTLGSARS